MLSLNYRNQTTRGLLAASLSIMLSACQIGSDGTTSTASTASTGTTARTVTTSNKSSGTTSGSATGIITLTWTAPVARTDGTPLSLSEIAGYRVHYSTSPGSYSNHVNITNGSLQSATLTGVPIGTYYVAMSTYDSSGLESGYSAPVIKKAL